MNCAGFTVKELTRTALMSALIAVCAWVSIPTAVPFTLQLLGIFTAVRLLGGRNGTLSIVLYIALGAAGLPVFANFGGGIGALAGPTGGYILGFIFIGLIYRAFEKRISSQLRAEAALLAGLAACYAFGTFWFMQSMRANGRETGFAAALSSCVFPFILPDIAKLILSRVLAAQLKRITG